MAGLGPEGIQAATKIGTTPVDLSVNHLSVPAAGIIEHPTAFGIPSLTQPGLVESAVPAVLGPSDVVARRTSAGSIEVPGPDQGLQYATREDARDMEKRYEADSSIAILMATVAPEEWQQELLKALRNGGIEGVKSTLYVKLLDEADPSVYQRILQSLGLAQ